MSGASTAGTTELAPVSETLFLPLYAVALESRSERPILADEELVRVTARLNELFVGSDKRIHRKLVKGRLPRTLVTTLSLRVRHFDQVARAFLERVPDGVVVSLGAGLSNRFRRVDNGKVLWFDLDFPAVIELRRKYLGESERARALASSVLDFAWMDQLTQLPGRSFLFLAEGLFPYLEEDQVRMLVVKLRERFEGAELAAEVANRRVVRFASGRLGRGKLRRQFGLSEDVWFHSGLSHPDEMEGWAEGIRFLHVWSHFDEDEPRLGWMRPLARFELFGKAIYVVRYRLGVDA